MKKICLKKLAVSGLVAGLCTLQTVEAAENQAQNKENIDYSAQNLNYHLMTEDELLDQLNDEGVKVYKSLSPEGKKLAREVASSACNNMNPCKGLNACKTDKNACNGQGACKGQGKCAQSDPNVAVKLVAKKMAEKRAEALQPNNSN
jgi:uncharacterized membrane-anchored protein YhcB (DUF1043 family)